MAPRLKVTEDKKSYYFMVPNLIDSLGLSVYAFRLYCRLKRVAGEDGDCWQSTKTLADACKMSPGSVVNARRELMQAGLIIAERVDNPHGGRDYYNVKIVDVWARNVASSPHEVASSPGELKNTPVKNTPIRIEEEEEPATQRPNIYAIYERTIGPITQGIVRHLEAAEETYAPDWIEAAFDEAAQHNGRSWSYVAKILAGWERNGFKADTRPQKPAGKPAPAPADRLAGVPYLGS